MKPKSTLRSFLILAGLGIAITSLTAAPTIYEPFAQSAGAITGKPGGTGLGNWAIDGTASTVATTPTLAYGQLANSGGELTLPSGGGNTAHVPTTSALADAGLLADGATLWFSFVYSKASGGGVNERSGFAFGTERLVTSGTTGAFMTNSGNGLGVFTKDKGILPITWNGGGSGVTGTGTAFTNYNDTVLIVGKVVWGATSGDVETLTIWSPNETSLPADEAALGAGFSKTMTGVDQTLFDTISMQQRNSGGNIIYDELRFGAAFSDLLPVDAVTPTLLSITDNQPGLTIYEDVAAVTYTLSFDRHMDVSTITADDFINAGTATATVGAITQVSARVISVQLLPTTTGTLQLKIPSGSVLSSFVPLNLNTTSDILDDRTFTIDPGPTPGNDRRWDGPTTTGITDGVGQGGTGNWSTSNTNWDRGPGIEAPAAWDNTAGTNHTAIFEGTAGTATLGEPISLKNLTFTHTTGTYTITGSTLNFTAGTITASAQTTTGAVAAIISSNITGAPAINLKPMDGDEQFTLNPVASGSMVIGAVSGDGGNGSEKLILQGGAGSTGTIASVTGPKVIVSAGSWTLSGASTGRDHGVSAGTLTLNANLTATHRAVILSGTGVLNYNVTNAVSATAATNVSTDNGFRITGGTLDQTSGAAINTNVSTTHIDLAGTLTFLGSNGADSNLHLGSGVVWLKDGNRQITVTNAATTLTIGGVIQNDDTLGRSLTKAGDGTLELRGASTYTGATTINAGTLKMGANNVIPDASNVTIGTATLDADTRTDTAGTLDVTGSGVINLGSGAALAFAKSSAVDWTDIPGTLNITGTLGATSLRFGDELNQPGLTPAQLALISVNGSGTGTYVLDANGYLIPGGGGDVTPPTLTSIADDVSGGPITEDASVTYTVTFSEDINSGTVSIADFDNQGTAALTINSAAETSPGVVTVVATPTTPGTLRLRIPSGAVIADTSGNNLVVPVSDDTTITVVSKYEAWSGGAAFNADANGDGVDNGLAFLLGASGPNANALDLLPEVSESSGNLVLTFTCLDDASSGSASLYVEHSGDLGISDPWQPSVAVDDDGNVLANGVTLSVVVNPGDSDLNDVTATISSSEAASGKLFGRLKAQP